MPYYDGRWHMFSEQERRAFGKSKRAEASKEWHTKWISKQRLKSDRLWTEKAILEFLGQPRDAGPIKAWLLKDVLAAENTESFKAWMQKRRAWLAERGKMTEQRMLKDHDMTKLEARGFHLRDELVRGQLDGISANLRLDGGLRIQIYQGCDGVYELQGQGRGRPKKHVMVDLEWFTPSWSICKRQNDQWDDLAGGSAQDVDIAVSEALSRFRELFPDIPIPAGIA